MVASTTAVKATKNTIPIDDLVRFFGLLRNVISVRLCTYNRSGSLSRTLVSLVEQNKINLNTVEVLVVDHNCTDGTMKMVGKSSRPCLRSE